MHTAGEARRRPPGTNLWRDPRTGVYFWRKVHRLTGKRFRKSTATKNLRLALRRVQQFEEAHEREAAGLTNYGDYRRPVAPFAEAFTASVGSSERAARLRVQLERAFRLLGIECLADLENFVAIERKLLRLEGGSARSRGRARVAAGRFARTTLARAFQSPLKQFSTWLAGRREIVADHLAAWPRLKTGPREPARRALFPDEVARVLAASEALERMAGHAHPSRPVWTALLVAAPRVSALAALDVGDLDVAAGRLALRGNRTKRAGAGALDDRTLAELASYVGDRAEGPLFLSPEGRRLNTLNSLRRWRRAASLAFVDMDWPEGEPRDLRMEYLVHYALSSGRVQVAMGGPVVGPHAPGPRKRASRNDLVARVGQLAEAIRPAWRERMTGVDQHCLRMTHRTWALSRGVPEILIDRQLGHSSPSGEAALRAAWSAVGRTHYTDMRFLTLDARRSAEAVRKALDEAEETLREAASSGFTAFAPNPRGRAEVSA
ncbi:MAG: hypothetical protein ACYTKD_31305 [Planctomycetota bacterium]|jgi:integrase